ncbi:MAG: Uma2 family endonuclease [Deltaproteobacteria bacterium]|nr:Uma2 family endonuclease [Myxococcales bacterium]MDP3221159.1 Uma2 family endonuclease [Deltaproteobacteria bacterium]
MGDAAEPTWIDHATYLDIERKADWKHEWLDGAVYAMPGGTLEHAQLSAQSGSELVRLATGCGCRVFSADAKVRVRATGLATYPDASVVCGPIERDPDDRNAMINPVVLVEVLSDGTEAYDRGEKFEHYRQLPSLRDYVLVSQRRPLVEVYSRDERDRWVLTAVGAGERFTLAAMEGAIEVDRIYAGVELLPAPPRSLGG